MLFQKEIHQVNQLTKRFNRDCRKIFAQMQEDIKQETLTKEVKTEESGGGNTMLYVGLAVAATAAAGLAYYLMRKKN